MSIQQLTFHFDSWIHNVLLIITLFFFMFCFVTLNNIESVQREHPWQALHFNAEIMNVPLWCNSTPGLLAAVAPPATRNPVNDVTVTWPHCKQMFMAKARYLLAYTLKREQEGKNRRCFLLQSVQKKNVRSSFPSLWVVSVFRGKGWWWK